MTKKFWIVSFIVSFLAVAITLPLGNWDHSWKLFAIAVLYIPLTVYYLTKVDTTRHRIYLLGILVLPPAVLYLPLMIFSWDAARVSFPSSMMHFVAVGFGTGIFALKWPFKVTLILVLLGFTLWMTPIGTRVFGISGYRHWDFWCSFHTFSGRVDETLSNYRLLNEDNESLSSADFRDKRWSLIFGISPVEPASRSFPNGRRYTNNIKKTRKLSYILFLSPPEGEQLSREKKRL